MVDSPSGSTNPVPPQRGQVVITVCFSTSKFSLMFSLSMRSSPVLGSQRMVDA
ncbi:MAG: hypothetical protein HC765_12445 [Brachymonas sp.]|nr:hypothetical protein [Brachymonas sp.]